MATIDVRLRPRGGADERAGVAPSRVSVVRGEKGRDKLVQVEGVEPAALRAALGA
jgi:uncharacterized protein YggU (UPF0235/DUF167 family)